ncbi:hypothetical protein HKBW3S43_01519, partial [Candidatus Hakubella thermalkaliphila]
LDAGSQAVPWLLVRVIGPLYVPLSPVALTKARFAVFIMIYSAPVSMCFDQ